MRRNSTKSLEMYDNPAMSQDEHRKEAVYATQL